MTGQLLLPWRGVPRVGMSGDASTPHAGDDGTVTPPAGLTAHTVEWSETIRLRTGVQVFTNAETGVYGNHDAAMSRAVALKVGFIRAMYQGDTDSNWFGTYCRDNDIKWLMTTTPESGTTNAELQRRVTHLANNNADVCLGLEGMNEPDQNRDGTPVRSDWAQWATDAAGVLYDAVQTHNELDGVPLLVSSLHDTASWNSYPASRSVAWTSQDSTLTYSAGAWRKTGAAAGDLLMLSAFIAPGSGSWASKLFGGYTSIRGTNATVTIEAWSATARLANLATVVLGSNAATAPAKAWTDTKTPAGTTRVRLRIEARIAGDVIITLGAQNTNTQDLVLAPTMDGGFRHFHQMAAAGVQSYAGPVGTHRYPGGLQPDNQLTPRLAQMQDAYGADSDFWITETGYQNTMDVVGGFKPVDEATAAVYDGRIIVLFSGIRKFHTSFFELLDDPHLVAQGNTHFKNVQAHWGLFRVGSGAVSEWTRKPAGDEVLRVLGWLLDSGTITTAPPQAYYNMDVGTVRDIVTLPVAKHNATTGVVEHWVMHYKNTKIWDITTEKAIADSSSTWTLTDAVGDRTITSDGSVDWVKLRTA